MQVPLQITFHNLRHSGHISETIEAHVLRLESLYERIISCRVVVDMPHKHHETGNLYQVRIDLTIPGHEIVVNRESRPKYQYHDLEVAVSQAFDAAQRQLEDLVCQKRAKHRRREVTVAGDRWPVNQE